MNKKYNIVFYGKINSGWDIETVKKNFSRLMKSSEGKIDLLFSGKPVVLKKNIEGQTAEKFKAGLEKIGAICEIEEIQEKTDLDNLTMEESASDESEIQKLAERLFICPSCGFQQIHSPECKQCGIIFSKFIQKELEEEPEQAPPQEVSKEMERAVARAKMIGLTSSMKHKKRYNLRKILKLARIGLVLLVFFAVVFYTAWTRSRIVGWEETLDVVIYPINGDKSNETAEFIGSLHAESFLPIETFMMAEAENYNFRLKKPVAIQLAPEIKTLPPPPPKSRNPFVVMWWSLKMRYWAYKHNTYEDSLDVRLFVIYKVIRSDLPQMEVSVGLRKGFMGIINTAPGDPTQDYTNIIIAHEMLHTFGAKDKYDYTTLMPDYPHGFADPEKKPLYPQEYGEIMAVRIPRTQRAFTMPESLEDVVIGETTCTEIKWCVEKES